MLTFTSNQDVKVTLNSELIFIKFLYFFNVLANPKPIGFTQTIPSMCEPKRKLRLRYSSPTFGCFSFSRHPFDLGSIRYFKN